MSVIQEALRRKMAEQRARDEEAGKSSPTPAPDSGGYVPPVLDTRRARAQPAPSRGEAFAPARRQEAPEARRNGPAVTPVWMLVVLLAFAGVALLWLQTQRDVEARRVALEAGHAESAPRVDPTPLPPRSASPSVAPTAEAAAPTARPVPTGATVPSSSSPAPIPAVAPVAAAPEDSPPPRGPVAARQVTVTRDDWPRIELVGILSGGGGRRSTAILNGSLVMIDAQIEGVTLAEVSEEGVYLEFMGDRQFIRIGEHTR